MQPPLAPRLVITCLCAAWCGVCREYRAVFDAAARDWPALRFVWLDVEDEADRVDPIEVENFPTLLIGAEQGPLFFGPVTPQASTLTRLIQAHAHGSPSAHASTDDIRALWQRLQPDAGTKHA